MPCKYRSKLDFNVLTMVNEGLQHLIINVLMVNASCTEMRPGTQMGKSYK